MCAGCRGLRPWQLLIDNAAPHECCWDNSRIVTQDDRNRYTLAGTHIWHICAKCARTHPTKPKRETPQ